MASPLKKLTRISLSQGFMFCSEQTINFHEVGFLSIAVCVGANGSGKSNVVSALHAYNNGTSKDSQDVAIIGRIKWADGEDQWSAQNPVVRVGFTIRPNSRPAYAPPVKPQGQSIQLGDLLEGAIMRLQQSSSTDYDTANKLLKELCGWEVADIKAPSTNSKTGQDYKNKNPGRHYKLRRVADRKEFDTNEVETGVYFFCDALFTLYNPLYDLVVMDEPDAAFHPFLTRTLLSVISVFPRTLSVLICSHSPEIVQWSQAESLNHFRKEMKDGAVQTLVTSLSGIYDDVAVEERIAFQSFCRTDHSVKQVLFAERVLLVEGKWDYAFYTALRQVSMTKGLLPWLIKATIVPIDGKGKFKHYKKLCSLILVPMKMILDRDALFTLKSHKASSKPTTSSSKSETVDSPLNFVVSATKGVCDQTVKVSLQNMYAKTSYEEFLKKAMDLTKSDESLVLLHCTDLEDLLSCKWAHALDYQTVRRDLKIRHAVCEKEKTSLKSKEFSVCNSNSWKTYLWQWLNPTQLEDFWLTYIDSGFDETRSKSDLDRIFKFLD